MMCIYFGMNIFCFAIKIIHKSVFVVKIFTKCVSKHIYLV